MECERIVLVEDQLTLHQTAQVLSEQLGSADVAVARDGASALRLVRQYRPDLVILSHDALDGQTGQIIQGLRRDPTTQTIPVLVLCSTARLGQTLCRQGASGYLVRPFDVDELLEVVRASRPSGKAA